MMPRSRTPHANALREALRRAQMVGPFPPIAIGLAAGLLASVISAALLRGQLGMPWRLLVDVVVFVVVAALTWLAVQRRDAQAAIEVMTWLNGWETERWERELGRRLPALPRARPQLLDALPDTLGLRPLRVELLMARGQPVEARQRWEQLPADTPWQRFERAALAEWIAWWEDEPDRTAEMDLRAEELDDPERTLVARAMIGAARARRAAVSEGDAIGPLASVRPLLGDRPRRYAFSSRTGVMVSVALVGLVALAVVVVGSLVSR